MEQKSTPQVFSDLHQDLVLGSVTRRAVFWHLHGLQLNHALDDVLQTIENDSEATAEFARLTGFDSPVEYGQTVTSDSRVADIDLVFTGETFPYLVDIVSKYVSSQGVDPAHTVVAPRPGNQKIESGKDPEFARKGRPKEKLTRFQGPWDQFSGALDFEISVDGTKLETIPDFSFDTLRELGFGAIGMTAAVKGRNAAGEPNGHLLNPTRMTLRWDRSAERHVLSLKADKDQVFTHNDKVLKNLGSGVVQAVCHGALLLLIDESVASPLERPAECLAKAGSVQRFHLVKGFKGDKGVLIAPNDQRGPVEAALGGVAKELDLTLVYK